MKNMMALEVFKMTGKKPALEITQCGIMSDGTEIQIEDWSKLYPHIYSPQSTIAAYPVSKWSFPGAFSPKSGQIFRAAFDFASKESCAAAFEALRSGEKTLADFTALLSPQDYVPAITGTPKPPC